MRIDLQKTMKMIEKNLPEDVRPSFEQLQKAYYYTLQLRSQILSIMYDMIDFGPIKKRRIVEAAAPVSQTENKNVVSLVIPEPLPGVRELTSAVEEHWVRMIYDAIDQQAKVGIPCFEKAFVLIRIYAPRGTNNARVWDTSNRAINVIINNLKGTFFEDDNFEHMACGIVADWSETGMTETRICDYEDLKMCEIFR